MIINIGLIMNNCVGKKTHRSMKSPYAGKKKKKKKRGYLIRIFNESKNMRLI